MAAGEGGGPPDGLTHKKPRTSCGAQCCTRGGGMSAIEAYLSKPWLAYYPKGAPAAVDVPPISVPEAFDSACTQNRARPAIAFYGARMTYGELHEAANR